MTWRDLLAGDPEAANSLAQNPHNTQNPPETAADPNSADCADSAYSPAGTEAADPGPRRLWLIVHPDGSRASHSCCPPATLAQVAVWYPDARSIEPEAPPPEPTDPPKTEAPEPADPPKTEAPEPTLARCAECARYLPNARGWGGLGRCQSNAPASRKPGSLWPRSEVRCREFERAAENQLIKQG